MSTICVMGVSGAGKSTVGLALAERLELPFVEGDDFHPPENVARMAAGRALTDAERRAWIAALVVAVSAVSPCVFSCSALNGTVRGWLDEGLPGLRYVWLDVSPETAARRVGARAGHFADARLVSSQFATLDPPLRRMRADAEQDVGAVVKKLLGRPGLRGLP